MAKLTNWYKQGGCSRTRIPGIPIKQVDQRYDELEARHTQEMRNRAVIMSFFAYLFAIQIFKFQRHSPRAEILGQFCSCFPRTLDSHLGSATNTTPLVFPRSSRRKRIRDIAGQAAWTSSPRSALTAARARARTTDATVSNTDRLLLAGTSQGSRHIGTPARRGSPVEFVHCWNRRVGPVGVRSAKRRTNCACVLRAGVARKIVNWFS